MQADNYPFKPAEASQVNDYRTLQDLLIRAPAGSAHDIAIRASTAYPRIVTRNAPVDFTPPGSTSDSDYGSGRCTNQRTEWFTGYYINKRVTLGWKSPLTEQALDNVIQIDARVDIPVAHQDMRVLQVEFIAYFRRWA
jgi:hypothetical protein